MLQEPELTPLTAASPGELRKEKARIQRRLMSQVGHASAEFGLIEKDDRIMVCVSGGKDSFSMLYLLREIQRKAPFPFSLLAVNLDQKQPGFPAHVLPRYFEREGYDYRILSEDTYSIVKEKVPEGKTYCSLCSRLRRGVLYNAAVELGATKIALGHHRDDLIETLLLNQFYSGQLKSMAPRLVSDDGRNVVIRPLCFSGEADIARFAELEGFPIIPCNLCGSQDNLKRQEVKQLLRTLEQQNPKIRTNLFAALRNVRSTHLLDRGLSRVAEPSEESSTASAGEPEEAAQLIPATALRRASH